MLEERERGVIPADSANALIEFRQRGAEGEGLVDASRDRLNQIYALLDVTKTHMSSESSEMLDLALSLVQQTQQLNARMAAELCPKAGTAAKGRSRSEGTRDLHPEPEPIASKFDPYQHAIEQLRDSAAAVDGLLKLQEQIRDSTGHGEMPDWWSEYYQSAVNGAIQACNEKTANAVDVLRKT